MNAVRSPEQRIGTLLVRRGALTEDEVLSALIAQVQMETGRRLGEILVEQGLISTQLLVRVLAEQSGVELQGVRAETNGGAQILEFRQRNAAHVVEPDLSEPADELDALEALAARLEQRASELAEREAEWAQEEEDLEAESILLRARVEQAEADLARRSSRLDARVTELDEREQELDERGLELDGREARLAGLDVEVELLLRQNERREQALGEREQRAARKEQELVSYVAKAQAELGRKAPGSDPPELPESVSV